MLKRLKSEASFSDMDQKHAAVLLVDGTPYWYGVNKIGVLPGKDRFER